MNAYFQTLAESFTHPVTAVAQLLGFVPLILGWFVFSPRSRRGSIAIKAAADGLNTVHYLLLGGWTGCAVCGVSVARGICFAQKGKNRLTSGLFLPVLFCLLTVGGSLLSWTGPESLLPMLGSCLAVAGYWQNDPSRLRWFNFAGICLWQIYSLVVFSVPATVGNVISLTSIVRTELRERRKGKEL